MKLMHTFNREKSETLMMCRFFSLNIYKNEYAEEQTINMLKSK